MWDPCKIQLWCCFKHILFAIGNKTKLLKNLWLFSCTEHIKYMILLLLFHSMRQQVLVSIVVSIPACHAGDRGSIPRRGGFILESQTWKKIIFIKNKQKLLAMSCYDLDCLVTWGLSYLIFHLQNHSSLGGLEPPTFRLTVERANQLRHRDLHAAQLFSQKLVKMSLE